MTHRHWQTARLETKGTDAGLKKKTRPTPRKLTRIDRQTGRENEKEKETRDRERERERGKERERAQRTCERDGAQWPTDTFARSDYQLHPDISGWLWVATLVVFPCVCLSFS